MELGNEIICMLELTREVRRGKAVELVHRLYLEILMAVVDLASLAVVETFETQTSN